MTPAATSAAASPAPTATVSSAPRARRTLDRDDLLMRAGVCLLIGWMLVTLVLPLGTLLVKSFQQDLGDQLEGHMAEQVAEAR